jgi:hypothetical protein
VSQHRAAAAGGVGHHVEGRPGDEDGRADHGAPGRGESQSSMPKESF